MGSVFADIERSRFHFRASHMFRVAKQDNGLGTKERTK
jgi:hypothetical protein